MGRPHRWQSQPGHHTLQGVSNTCSRIGYIPCNPGMVSWCSNEMPYQVDVDHIILILACFSAAHYEAPCISGACLVALVEEINHTGSPSRMHPEEPKDRRCTGGFLSWTIAAQPAQASRFSTPPSERRAHLREPPRRGSPRTWRLSRYPNRTSPRRHWPTGSPSPQTWVARVLFSNLAPAGPIERA